MFAYLVATLVIAWSLGTSIAIYKKSFLVDVDDPNVVVLRICNGTVIAARIDRKTRRIRPVYIVSKLSPRPTVYRLEKVGPLRR